MKDKAYLYYIYCKVKDRIQIEKQVIQSDQDVHMYGLWWMEWKLLLYDLSPYINSFESMAISFFSWTFMCPDFFLSILFQYLDLHVSIFFLDSPCLFFFKQKLERERETNTYSGAFILWNEWTVQC